jgi:hypothetical protein
MSQQEEEEFFGDSLFNKFALFDFSSIFAEVRFFLDFNSS